MIAKVRALLEKSFTSELFSYEQLRGMFLTLILDQFFIVFINVLSTSMASSTGEAAMAAVNMVGSVNALVVLIFSAVSVGGALYPRAEPLLIDYSIEYMRLMCLSFVFINGMKLGVPIASEAALFQGGMLLVQVYLAYLTTGEMAAHHMSTRAIMAVGAHTGDAQLTSGLLLARYAQQGDRIVTLDLTAGERGAPKGMSTAEFREQNVEFARKFANHLGGESIVLDTPDGELTYSQDTAICIADIMRQYDVSCVLYHWKNSMHKDHIAASPHSPPMTTPSV